MRHVSLCSLFVTALLTTFSGGAEAQVMSFGELTFTETIDRDGNDLTGNGWVDVPLSANHADVPVVILGPIASTTTFSLSTRLDCTAPGVVPMRCRAAAHGDDARCRTVQPGRQ